MSIKFPLSYFFASRCYVFDREQYDASDVYNGCKYDQGERPISFPGREHGIGLWIVIIQYRAPRVVISARSNSKSVVCSHSGVIFQAKKTTKRNRIFFLVVLPML